MIERVRERPLLRREGGASTLRRESAAVRGPSTQRPGRSAHRAPRAGALSTLTQAIRDGGVITWRNLLGLRRVPEALIGMTVQPIILVLLFALVFAGSLGGAAYREFLIAGIFAQTVTFNVFLTTIAMANDLQKGIIDRFRSLPMSRVAVVLGRTMADLGVGVLTLVVTSVTGLVVGWRIRGNVLDALAGFALLLLFSFAMSWVGVLVGLTARTVEVAQSAGLVWVFPMAFVSSAFVSVQGFPGWLQPFGEWNPVSAVAHASRELFGNPTQLPGFPESHAWPAQHAVLYVVLSSLTVIAVFLPLATARYRRLASR